jgi:hypothetical protein
MMELFWTPEAIQDRNDIYGYIEADNPVAALALDELFVEMAGGWSITLLSGDLDVKRVLASW